MGVPLTPIVGLQSTFLEPFNPPLTQAPPQVGIWVPDQAIHRRWLPRPRRAYVASPPLAAAVAAAPPAWVPSAQRRRPVILSLRRARVATTIPLAVVVAASVWLPDAQRRRLSLFRPRRALLAALAPQAPVTAPITPQARQRPRWPLQRRVRLPQPLPQAVVVQPPLLPPQANTIRRRLVPARRGQVWAPPWGQQAQPGVQTFIGWGSRPLRRFWPPQRRARTLEPPWAQQAQAPLPPVPLQAQRRRPTLIRWRRTMTAAAPYATPAALSPQLFRARRLQLPWRRRSTIATFVPARVGVLPPQPAARRRLGLQLRRGRTTFPWPQAVQPPPPLLVDRGRRYRHKPPFWPRRARVTFTIPFQAPGILRDVDLVVYPPLTRWSAGPVGSRWVVKSPGTRWSTGILASRWRASSPSARWKADPPEQDS